MNALGLEVGQTVSQLVFMGIIQIELKRLKEDLATQQSLEREIDK
jgi:hypothetical protein